METEKQTEPEVSQSTEEPAKEEPSTPTDEKTEESPKQVTSDDILNEMLTYLRQNQVNQESYINAIKDLNKQVNDLQTKLADVEQIAKENAPTIVKSFDYDKEFSKDSKKRLEGKELADKVIRQLKEQYK